MEQSFFRELLHYQRPKDNPFRLVFAGLVMFSILFLGYINHQLLISSFGSLGIFANGILVLAPIAVTITPKKAPGFEIS